MTVALETFIPDIAVECSGASNPLILSAVRTAVIEFCRKSLYWQEEADPVPIIKGVAEYEMYAPTGRQIVQIMSVNIDGNGTLPPLTLEQVERALPQWRTVQGSPVGFVAVNPETFRLTPVPDATGTLTATVAYAPTRTGGVVPDAIYDQHFEVIKHGTLARLKAMMGHAFYDPQAAIYYTGRFNAGVNAAAVERNKGFSRANLRVEPRAFV